MIISTESTVVQPSPKKNSVSETENDSQLKKVFIDVLKSKNEYDESCIEWLDDETVSCNNVSTMSLHSFLLQAEKMGKDISYTKKTIIKIS